MVGLEIRDILSICSAGANDHSRTAGGQDDKVFVVMQSCGKSAIHRHSRADCTRAEWSFSELECSYNLDNRIVRKLEHAGRRIRRCSGELIYEMVQSSIERSCWTIGMGICKSYLCAS